MSRRHAPSHGHAPAWHAAPRHAAATAAVAGRLAATCPPSPLVPPARGWQEDGGELAREGGVKRGRASRRSEARGAGGSRRARFGRGRGADAGRRTYFTAAWRAPHPQPSPEAEGRGGGEGEEGVRNGWVGEGGVRAVLECVAVGCRRSARVSHRQQVATLSEVCTSREEGATHESLLFSSIKNDVLFVFLCHVSTSVVC